MKRRSARCTSYSDVESSRNGTDGQTSCFTQIMATVPKPFKKPGKEAKKKTLLGLLPQLIGQYPALQRTLKIGWQRDCLVMGWGWLGGKCQGSWLHGLAEGTIQLPEPRGLSVGCLLTSKPLSPNECSAFGPSPHSTGFLWGHREMGWSPDLYEIGEIPQPFCGGGIITSFWQLNRPCVG